MPRRRHTTNDAPATVPAVVPGRPAPRSDWSGWSADYERKRLESEVRARQQTEDAGLYPRELAERIAADIAKTLIPDWRLTRQEFGATVTRLIQQQPEMSVREIRQLDKVLGLILDNLPAHIQPLLGDARLIIEQRAIAREAAAFTIGVETGRRLAVLRYDEKGRLRKNGNPAGE